MSKSVDSSQNKDVSVILQVIVRYFLIDCITVLSFLSTANRAHPHFSNTIFNTKGVPQLEELFGSIIVQSRPAQNFQRARSFASYVRQQILTAPTLPAPLVFLHEYNWPVASTRLLPSTPWLSHSRVPAKGREVDGASDSDPESNRRRTWERRKSLTRQTAAAASSLFQAV